MEQIQPTPPPTAGKDAPVPTRKHKLDTGEQNAVTQGQCIIGESLMDMLCFKYADMPTGKHILRELEHHLIGNTSVPQYITAHQHNNPVIRTEYYKLQDIGLVSYRSLYTVIKVGTQTLPIVASIIPDMNGPLMLGMNYRDAHGGS